MYVSIQMYDISMIKIHSSDRSFAEMGVYSIYVPHAVRNINAPGWCR